MHEPTEPPRDLLTLDQWDTFENDPTRRWELTEPAQLELPCAT